MGCCASSKIEQIEKADKSKDLKTEKDLLKVTIKQPETDNTNTTEIEQNEIIFQYSKTVQNLTITERTELLVFGYSERTISKSIQQIIITYSILISPFFRHESLTSQMVLDSENIILMCILQKQLKPKNIFESTLLYQASKDPAGYSAHAFHDKCNYISPTLTIIWNKVGDNGHVFGGYTEAFWKSEMFLDKYGNDKKTGEYETDNNAFLFSLRGCEDKYKTINDYIFPIKTDQTQFAIYNVYFYGPTFGRGHDIYTRHNANEYYGSKANAQSYDSSYQFVGYSGFKIWDYQVWHLCDIGHCECKNRNKYPMHCVMIQDTPPPQIEFKKFSDYGISLKDDVNSNVNATSIIEQLRAKANNQ
eukprot:415393_1